MATDSHLRRAIALSLVLAACGPPTEEEFTERYIRITCEFIVECWADLELYDDVDACVDELTAGVTPNNCVYHEDAARDCLEATEDLECPDEGEILDTPAECAQVYTDCPGDPNDTF